MIVKEILVKNISGGGLHARPSAILVQVANMFESSIAIENPNGQKANAKSIVALLSLVIISGATIKIYAEGKDENAAMDRIVNLLTT